MEMEDALDTKTSHEYSRSSAEFSDHDSATKRAISEEVGVRHLAYASLPPTPILPSPPASPPPIDRRTLQEPLMNQMDDSLFSLWDYLREELLATDFDSHQELKWKRVSNFLSIPYAIEKACTHPLVMPTTLLTCADRWLRIYSMLGLIPLHIHHPSDSIHPCHIPSV